MDSLRLMDSNPGVVFQSSVQRMFMHSGFMLRFFKAVEYEVVTPPVAHFGSSGGALAASSTINKKSLYKFLYILRDLTPNQIFSYDKWLKGILVLEVLQSLSSLLSDEAVRKIIDVLSQEKGFTFIKHIKSFIPILRFTRPAVSMGVKALLLHRFVNLEAILDNSPLRRLIDDNMEEEIFAHSTIKLHVGATNIRTGKLEKFTNYEAQDVGNKKRLVSAILASAGLPVYFPLTDVDGEKYVDAALVSSAPIDWAREKGCNPIWLLSYTGLGQREKKKKYETWFDILYRSLDIVITEHTRVVVEEHMRTNNDLKLARERGIDTEGFSFHGKQETELILVQTSETMPEVDIHDLDSQNKERLIEIGYACCEDTIRTRLATGLPM